MDTLAFVRTLTSQNLGTAVEERTKNFHDLVWGREANRFLLSLDAAPLPEAQPTPDGGPVRFARYEVTIHADVKREVVEIERENVTVHRPESAEGLPAAERGGTQSTFCFEQKGLKPAMRASIEPFYSLLDRAPFGDENFPEALWLRNALKGDGSGVCPVSLKVEELGAPSPPYKGPVKSLTGSYLPRFVAELQDKSPEQFSDWIKHLRTCLPDLESVRTILRPEDRHRYVMLRYKNGIEVPSWVVSDGTLRLMALTVLAYMPNSKGIYLIEEPENGLHPTAIEAIYQSLSSIYAGQVLMASHSPILLSLAKPEELLCFTKSDEGTQIIPGDKHPRLRDWKGEVNLSELFAAGVLS
jgi:hypothetical protein